jgi:hypothetical protein
MEMAPIMVDRIIADSTKLIADKHPLTIHDREVEEMEVTRSPTLAVIDPAAKTRETRSCEHNDARGSGNGRNSVWDDPLRIAARETGRASVVTDEVGFVPALPAVEEVDPVVIGAVPWPEARRDERLPSVGEVGEWVGERRRWRNQPEICCHLYILCFFRIRACLVV